MTISRAQLTVAAIFLCGLLLNAAALAVVYARGAIFADNFRSLLQTILAAYSGPLAIIVAGFFAQEKRDETPAAATFWFALAVTAIWNVLLIWGACDLLLLSFGSEPKESAVDDFSSYLSTISSSATFLVSGALTYFFVKRS